MDNKSCLSRNSGNVDNSLDVIRRRLAAGREVVVVIDDDPTGTQSVANIPILTRWGVADLKWAMKQSCRAVYVLTNTRSVDQVRAARRNREVVSHALIAADSLNLKARFVSRGDSTLRGHFPLETDVISEAMRDHGEPPVDAVLLVPAFPDAGRITVDGVHYLVGAERLPIAETEFAKDATFGYENSSLVDWVAEKSEGRFSAETTLHVDLATLDQGPEAVAAIIRSATEGAVIICDAENEKDLRVLALGALLAEEQGANLVYRTGPPFIRPRIGQEKAKPLEINELGPSVAVAEVQFGGLIVVGSHVGITGEQLRQLKIDHPEAKVLTLDAQVVVNGSVSKEILAEYINTLVCEVRQQLSRGDVILQTSRTVIRDDDADESLAISRRISAALVAVVRDTLDAVRPSFVIAKGGITSSDVATKGLCITRAVASGTLLSGLVSLWRSVDGPAAGIPYAIFPGNVGDSHSLSYVLDRFINARTFR